MLDPSRPSLPVDLVPQILSYIPANRESQSTLLSLQRTCTSAFPEGTRKLYENVFLKDPFSLNYLINTFRPSKMIDTQDGARRALEKRVGLYRVSLKKIIIDFIPPIYLLPSLPVLHSSDETNARDSTSKEHTSVLFPQCTTIEFTKRAYQRAPFNSFSLPSSFFPTTQDSMDVLISFLVKVAHPDSLEIYKPNTYNYKLEQNWYLFFTKLTKSWSSSGAGSMKTLKIIGDDSTRLKILNNDIEHHFIYANLDDEEVYTTLPGYLKESQQHVERNDSNKDGYSKNIRLYAEKIYHLIKPPFEFSSPYHSFLNAYNPISTTPWVIHLPSTINGSQIRRNQLNDVENSVVESVKLWIPNRYHELCVDVNEGDEEPKRLRYIRWSIDD